MSNHTSTPSTFRSFADLAASVERERQAQAARRTVSARRLDDMLVTDALVIAAQQRHAEDEWVKDLAASH